LRRVSKKGRKVREMEITTTQVQHEDERVVHGNLLRVSLDGEGCPEPRCNCSPGYFILISNGDTSLAIDLSPEEAAAIRNTGRLELSE
jgi:hypothetical protein